MASQALDMAEASESRPILVAYGGDIYSENALSYYSVQVRKAHDYLILVTCLSAVGNGHEPTSPNRVRDMLKEERIRREYEEKLMQDDLKAKGLTGKCIVGDGNVVDTIIKVAQEHQVQLIVLGSKYLGKTVREATGSTKSKLVLSQDIHVPILVVKKQGLKTPSGIAVLGTDLERPSLKALKVYKEHFYKKNDQLFLVYSPKPRMKPVTEKRYPPQKVAASISEEEEASYRYSEDMLRDKLRDLEIRGDVLRGYPGESPGASILKHAEEKGAHFVVIGSNTLGAATRKFNRESTTDNVLNESKMSVLVVKL